MKNKILVIWYKLSIHRCNVAIKFYSRLKSFFDKPLTKARLDSILIKILGVICIINGIAIIIKGYANPVSTGIMYICVGLLCMIAKSTAGDTK